MLGGVDWVAAVGLAAREVEMAETRSILAGGDRPAPSGATGGILSRWNEETGHVEYADARDVQREANEAMVEALRMFVGEED